MPSRRQLLTAAPLALLPALPARAAGERLRAVILHLEPLAFLDGQGRLRGIFADTLAELGREAQVQIEVQLAPYARAAAMLTASNAELIAAIPGNKLLMENESVGVLVSLDVLAVGRAGLRLERLQDLRGKTVAILRAARYGGPLDEETGILRYETNSHEQAVKMLVERRVDAVVGGEIALMYAMRKLGVTPQQQGTVLKLHRTQIHLMLARRLQDAGLTERLRKGMQTLHASGRLEALVQRYTS